MRKKDRSYFDVVIVGAGLVGTSVVVGLRGSGLRIAVLEQHLSAVLEPQKADPRPLSLAYGSRCCLERWGAWSGLAPAAMAVSTLHVSEQGCLGRVKIHAKDYGLPALAYVVPFSLLQQQLIQLSVSEPNVTFISVEDIAAIATDKNGVTIEFIAAGQRQSLQATLLVAADGSRSKCRDLLQIKIREHKGGETAFIMSLAGAHPHNAVAYQRFTSQGSLALLPIFDAYQYRLVWTMNQQRYQQLTQYSDELLLSLIVDLYGGRLNKLLALRREGMFPLVMKVVDKISQPSVVLLGNAAHTIYPLAAQGFNLSLQDVSALTQVLIRAHQQGEAINDPAVLGCYTERRRDHQKAVIDWTRLISMAFQWNIPGCDHFRGMALLGMDTVPFLKKRFGWNFLHV